MPIVAPWLQTGPRDYIAAAERGASLGQAAKSEKDQVALAAQRMAQSAQAEQQQIALAHQRLDEQAQQVQVMNQARQQQQERNFLLGQQRNQIADAYHQAATGLQKQKLEQAAQMSARKFAAQQKLSALVASGVPFDKAIMQTPELIGIGVETALTKTATATAPNQKMSDVDKLKYSTAQKELAAGEKELSGIGWFGSKKGPTDKIQSAKAVMDEITKKYGASPAVAASPAATHTWNPDTGKIEPVKSGTATDTPPMEMSPSGVPMLPRAGNTYGGMGANEHFQAEDQ